MELPTQKNPLESSLQPCIAQPVIALLEVSDTERVTNASKAAVQEDL